MEGGLGAHPTGGTQGRRRWMGQGGEKKITEKAAGTARERDPEADRSSPPWAGLAHAAAGQRSSGRSPPAALNYSWGVD